MLTVSNLYKSFHHKPVLSDINFTIEKGETVALSGPNGAGKTTLLRILARIASKDSGTIMYSNGGRNILYLGHSPGFYPALTLAENMNLIGSLRGQTVRFDEADSILDTFSLLMRKNDPVRDFSQGMLQRLKLVTADILDWDILLMDEPYSTLDEEGRGLADELLLKWKRAKRTVLFVDHDPERAKDISDREFFLLHGKITENGAVS